MTHPPAKKRANGEDDDDSSLPPPPDGGWGWWVVFGSFMIHIVADGVTYSFGLFIDEFTPHYNAGRGETAWIASILVGVTLCSGPISSSLVNKYGCRPVTIAGAILASFCLSISMYAPNVIFLYFSVGLGTGLGFGLIYLPAIVSVTSYFERLRSLATGIAVCGSGLGTFIYAPLIRFLIANLGWQISLLIVGISVLSCVFFGALFRPLEKISPISNENAEAELQPLNDTQKIEDTQNWRHSVCNGDIPKEGEWSTNNGLLAPPTKMNSSSAHDISSRLQTNEFGKTTNGGHVGRFLKSETARMTMSHPALLNPAPKTPPTRHRGVMDRKDVFFTGSRANLEMITKSTPKLNAPGSNPDFGKVVPLITTEPPTPSREQRKVDPEEGDDACCGMSKSTMKEMMDFSVLKNPVFILFTVSNFCTSVGFNIPYVYITPQAESLGIDKTKASMLLAVIGIANTVGRIILGYISDKPWVNRLLIYNLCLTICGLATMASVFCTDFASLVVYTSVWGFTIGAYVGLTSVILVDLLGLEMLTNAFGVLLLFQGFASLLGPPIAGWLYDGLQSYNPGFLVSGVAIAASGLMLFAIPMLQRSQLASSRP